jgi:hypothetical protein
LRVEVPPGVHFVKLFRPKFTNKKPNVVYQIKVCNLTLH